MHLLRTILPIYLVGLIMLVVVIILNRWSAGFLSCPSAALSIHRASFTGSFKLSDLYYLKLNGSPRL